MSMLHAMRKWLLLCIFIVSGFTGLIYESIWSHYLKLFLGHAAYAQTLVLAMFMGGMALGSWLVARHCTRIRRLLLAYVAVEVAIGVLGLVFHQLFVGLTDWSFASVIPVLGSEGAVHAFKWALAGLLILPQSALLGTTFPLISGGIIRRWPERSGQTLALLYFTNSLGAAIGVLVGGFVLIRTVGLPGTLLTAGLLNLLLAACVWLLVRNQDELQPAAEPAAPGVRGNHNWFLWAAFFTGAASFLYEIGWIRMLSLVLGSSTHSFELMLSAFIFGLAFGGLWMHKRIDRIADPVRYLGIVMLVMGGFALLTLPVYAGTFDVMAWAMQTFSPTKAGYAAFNLVSHGIAILIMVPTTFCAGMTLPLLTHALLKRTGGERAIGTVYAANTLGAILGVLVAVHVAMPLVGVKGVIISGAGIHMALGLSGLVLLARVAPATRLRTAVACAAALLVVGLFVRLDPMRMTSSVYRTGEARLPDDTRVTYLRDGKTATISLAQRESTIVIATNGKPDATIEMGNGPAAPDEITMILAAALPLSLHSNPQRVANIGFGSGLTSHTLLGSDRVQHLDSVEIEPFMVEAARLAFYPRIKRVFDDPRSRIVYDDARTFLATARAPYDIIVSEPSNPWVSGVATLFSQEFYQRVGTYLKPDGYFVQWLQIYETDMSVIASVMKALASQFPTFAMYSADDSNVLIVATRAGALPGESAGIFDSALLRSELARVGITSIGDIQQRRIGDARVLEPMFRSYPVPTNSDYFPFVDLNAPRLRYMRASAIELPNLLTFPVPVNQIAINGESEPHAAPPSGTGQLFRDHFVRTARALRDAMLRGSTGGLEPARTREVLLVRMDGAQCKDPAAQTVWRRAVQEISDLTSRFLTEAELKELWAAIRSTPCYSEHAGLHRDWADLLAAIALRDVAGIARLGNALIKEDTDRQLSVGERAFLIISAAAAKIHDGASDEAERMLAEAWDSTDLPAYYELTVRQLLALSRVTPDTTAPAGSDVPPALVERVE